MRGTVRAAAFIFDVPVIGEDEARRRVLALWSAGASLRALDDGRWLLALGAPVSVRAERAPGLAVQEEAGALFAAGAVASFPGVLSELRHGELTHVSFDELRRIDPSAWLSVAAAVELRVLDAVPVPIEVTMEPAAVKPDLREAAGIGEPVEPPRRPGLLARLVERLPIPADLSRYTRYLEDLTRAFERGDYENALRDAISLGGESDTLDWLEMGLPNRREGPIGPTPRLPEGGSGTWFGDNAYAHLTQLYRQAAVRLEEDGEIERAAFVHSDLLHAPRDAITLLERHERYELAARLAEGRDLNPELVVRLWWQAGNRERAVTIARVRRAFATAVERLERTDPAAALQLREAWRDDERGQGNWRSAIDVAWEYDELRATIGPDLEALRALGGVSAASALGLELAWRADLERLEDALALLGDAGGERAGERGALLESVAAHEPADPMAARRLAGAGLRALLRDASARRVGATRGGVKLYDALREHADPLLRADLPALPGRGPAPGVLLVDAHEEPAGVPVYDAACLPGGVLVALGERGLALLTHDGREKARWDLPAQRLSLADHGGTALVHALGEAVTELYRLDIAARKVSRIGAFTGYTFADSYDGSVLLGVSEEGLEGIDVNGDPPRLVWTGYSELEGVMSVARSPTHMAAILGTSYLAERFVWDGETRRQRSRLPVIGMFSNGPVTTADGWVFWLERDEEGASEVRVPPTGGAIRQRLSTGGFFLTHGVYSARAWNDELTRRMVLRVPPDHTRAAVLSFAHAPFASLRVLGDVATVWSPDGRVLGVDLGTRECVVNLWVR